MNKGVRNTVLGLLLVIGVVVGLTVNKFTGTQATIDKAELRERGLVWYDTPRTFVFNPLVTSAGEFTREDLHDQWTLLFFGFTFCPDVCPIDNARNAALTDLRAEQALDIQPVFITIDPERDTAEYLADYTYAFECLEYREI